MYGLKRNGITVAVCTLPDQKKPALTLQFDGDNCVYKVASFVSKEQASWFEDRMQKFFEGMIDKEGE